MNRSDKAAPVFRVIVNYGLCHFCGACVAVCVQDAMFLRNSALVIQNGRCTACERCLKVCPLHALTLAESLIEAVS
jgi:formate hydrogenlyase subunit 6/NADH:ubiquinone oxidoreductase subunit I